MNGTRAIHESPLWANKRNPRVELLAPRRAKDLVNRLDHRVPCRNAYSPHSSKLFVLPNFCFRTFMKTEPSPVKPGDIIAGKYRVDRLLGQGGMGVVVAATHVELRDVRAIKLLLNSTLGDSENVERFRREARTVLRLKSQHVARVLDVGKLENGAPFMVMEYLHGSDLGEVIKQHGPVPLENAILYVLQAMDAVAEAHAKGIIHRDLKPANLFLTTLPSGMPCVKVLDFGISKISKESSQDVDMTRTHAVLGSPQFMSPEQMRATRDVDPRTDIWSLGVILYQLTTAKVPFRGRSSTEIIANMFSTRPEPPSRIVPRIPRAFDDIVLRCLRLDAAERFATVAQLAAALAPFAPPAASFTLERIARYANADARKTNSTLPAVDGSAGAAEDLFTPSPYVPSDWITPSGSETNDSETISSAPTNVLHGAAIAALEAETISIQQTKVMQAAPNQFSGQRISVTELMAPSPPQGPSAFSAARTNVLHRPQKNPLPTTTDPMPPHVPPAAAPEPQATATSTGASTSGTSAWGGTQTHSWYNRPPPGNRVGYIVVAAISAVVLVLVLIGVAFSGSRENTSKPAGNGLSTPSAPSASSSARLTP